jgi:hypothetical protein
VEFASDTDTDTDTESESESDDDAESGPDAQPEPEPAYEALYNRLAGPVSQGHAADAQTKVEHLTLASDSTPRPYGGCTVRHHCDPGRLVVRVIERAFTGWTAER